MARACILTTYLYQTNLPGIIGYHISLLIFVLQMRTIECIDPILIVYKCNINKNSTIIIMTSNFLLGHYGTYDREAPGRCSKTRADDLRDYHDEHDDVYSFIHYPSIHPSIVIKINFDFDQLLLKVIQRILRLKLCSS